MNKLVKNYLFYMLYEAIALIVPLFTAPYLTRVLHAEEYGIYSYVFSATSLICTISLIGLNSYGSRQTAYDRDKKSSLNTMFWELFTLRILCGVIGTAIFFTYASIVGYSAYFLLFYAYYLANVVDCSWFFVGIENMLPCVLKNALSKLAMLAGTFLFVKSEEDVGNYLLVVAVPTLIANLSICPLLRKYIGKPQLNCRKTPQHLMQSIALCMPTIVTQLYLQVDKIMIEWLTNGTSEVSFYDQAEKIVVIPLSIITSLSAVMMPRLANEYAKNRKDEIEHYLVLTGKYSMFIAAPMMFGIIAIAQWAVPWYLGSEYTVSSFVLMLLSPMLVLNSLSGLSGNQYLVATNQTKVLLVSSIAAALSNIIFNAVLIPRFGCIGAAVATVVANGMTVIIQYRVMCKQIRFGAVFRAAVKYLAVGAVMCAVVFAVTLACRWTPTPWVTVTQIAIGFITYCAILLIIKDEMLFYAVNWLKNKRKA